MEREGEFIWDYSREPVTFAKWADGEPNEYLGTEDYLQLSSRGWNDVPWSTSWLGIQHSYICETGKL